MSDIFLYPGESNPSDIRLRDPLTAAGGGGGSTIQVSPSRGILSIVGNAPAILIALAVGAGGMLVSGKAPAVVKQLAPTTGQTVLTGRVPAIQRTFLPSSGGLTLIGRAPTFVSGLQPSTGGLIFAGQAPTLQKIYAPSSGRVILAGNAPSFGGAVSTIIAPSAGRITIAGGVPSLQQWQRGAASSVVFDYKYALESMRLGVDFLSNLQAGEILSAGIAYANLYSGLGALPELSAVSVSGTSAEFVVTGGTPGCIYTITCTGLTDQDNFYSLYGYLSIL